VGATKAGSLFGKYRLNRLLGQGGMGEVYEAHDTTKDRTVALKILPEELSRDEGFRSRFQTGVRSTETSTSICGWSAGKIYMNCCSAVPLSPSGPSASSVRSERRWMPRTRRV
jgi:serine/threonine protein kinase